MLGNKQGNLTSNGLDHKSIDKLDRGSQRAKPTNRVQSSSDNLIFYKAK
jgi:hypothetical protein